MCGLSVYQTPFSKAKLKELYGNKDKYVKQVDVELAAKEKDIRTV